jgi:threonylcarbamoyladenosine tRNA methylthiotransferase MtaB
MKIAFKTFGCKANSVDTDYLVAEATRRGWQIVPEEGVADAYVINSCTVTHAADRDARSQVLRYKRRNPDAMVAVVGCYAQVAAKELLDIAQVDVVVGTANKSKVLEHFEERKRAEEAKFERLRVEAPKGYLPERFAGSRNARAPIKIQDGCNFKCAFCIIPDARGRSRSLPLETVLRQFDDAWAQGYREVVLTGIHLAHYGWDLGTDLMALLKAALAKPEGPRIRLSTLDPFEIPDELVAMVGSEPRLCPHFHIAIQSGSDRVLAKMRRIYKASEFEVVAEKIHRQCPDTFIGLDVIVGFPGESDKAFEETLRQLERTYWTKAHVFPFSARAGTAAAAMHEEAIPASVITERSAILRRLSDEKLGAFHRSQIGKTREMVLERPVTGLPGFWIGHTDNYVATVVPAGEGFRSKDVLSVRLEGAKGERMTGRPVASMPAAQAPGPNTAVGRRSVRACTRTAR